MELNIPGCIVSPLCLKSHMTAPHDRAAKAVKYLELGGRGFTTDPARAESAVVL